MTTPAPGAPLMGTWQPDAREVDPGLVVDTDPRSAFLSNFTGLNANGTWTLFLADLESGGTSALDSWGLEITGVPEPQQYALTIGLGLIAFAFWRNQRKRRKRLRDISALLN
jgi:hypothetical protein